MTSALRLSLVVGLLFWLFAPSPGWAHAQLLFSTPTKNAVLTAPPSTIELVFNEPVTPLALRFIDTGGSTIEMTAAGGERVVVALPPDLVRGTHALSWRVVSADGHPVAGTLVFSIGEPTGAVGPAPADGNVPLALWLGRLLLFIAMFGGIGGACFLAIAPLPGPARRLAAGLSALGLVLSPVTLGLQGVDALGQPITAVLQAPVWSAALTMSYAATSVVLGLAFVIALAALLAPPGRAGILLGLLAALLASASLALSGHASAAAPQWLTRPAVVIHIAAVMFWIGALLPLCILLRDRSAEADRALARFSRSIPLAIAPLVVSGIILAAIQLGPPGQHWVSPYSALLAVKLGLLVFLLGLALWNRRVLTVPTLHGHAAPRAALRLSIACELLIVLAILGLVAGWRMTPPPRALAAVESQASLGPLRIHLMDDAIMATALIAPGRAGPVTVDLDILDVEGLPKQAQAVAVTFASPTLGFESFKQPAAPVGAGWRAEGFTLPLAGTWTMTLEIRVSRFVLVKLETDLVIPD